MTDSNLASGQPYELFMFARKHGLTVSQARKIVDRYGSDRAGADGAATAVVERDLEDGIDRSKKVYRASAGLWEEALPAAAIGTNASPADYRG
jgi:hypothetical protein